MNYSKENGFTLIELLVVIALIGILSALSVNGYHNYVASAGYGSARITLNQGRVALEAAMTQPDIVLPDVNFTQATQGRLADADAARLMPEFQLSRNSKISIFNDPACITLACLAQRLTVRHCKGERYVYWSRWGDGSEVLVEDVPGRGC